MNIKDAYPSNYLKASDLGAAQPIVTITGVKMEAIGRGKELKPVLYFAGKEKGLVLNKTNCNKIIELLKSGDTDEWEGQKIRLFATETEFAGETVDCIRVKAAAAQTTDGKAGKKKKPAPPPVDEEFDTDGDDYNDSDPVPF